MDVNSLRSERRQRDRTEANANDTPRNAAGGASFHETLSHHGSQGYAAVEDGQERLAVSPINAMDNFAHLQLLRSPATAAE